MLRNLQVRNYVLIDSLEIDFPEGLIIITGQTGAGKSILLGALSLVLGAKGDAQAIAQGADSCVVEAEFSVDLNDSSLVSVLDENDIEYGEDGILILRRVIYSSGRSRSFVNDVPVSLQILSGLSSRLLDIHSQHQTLMLSDKQFQLSVLDYYAGNSTLLSECATLWSELQAAKSELADVSVELDRLLEGKEYNEAQFNQLEQANLRDGELEELDAEQRQLANAEEIKEGLTYAQSLISPDSSEVPSMSVSLKEVEKSLSKLSRFVPSIESLAERVSSARLEIEDIEDEINSVNSSTELSESRLVEVEDRMTLIYDLFKKHSCRTIAELLEVKQKYSSALFDTDSLDSRKASLEAKVADLSKKHKAVADKLHESRIKNASAFTDAITSSIRGLELDRAVFDLSIDEVSLSRTGYDQVKFLFSSNGTAPTDIAKCASGGELSRIMLCLKAMLARYTSMPTLIFDEIDTGVSGNSIIEKNYTFGAIFSAKLKFYTQLLHIFIFYANT